MKLKTFKIRLASSVEFITAAKNEAEAISSIKKYYFFNDGIHNKPNIDDFLKNCTVKSLGLYKQRNERGEKNRFVK